VPAPAHPLPEDIQPMWDRLMALDFHSLISTALFKKGISNAPALLRDCLMLLIVKNSHGDDPQCELSMPAAVDEVWHQLILDTTLYTAVCEAIGSKGLIRHNPYGEFDSEEDKTARRNAMKGKFREVMGFDYVEQEGFGIIAQDNADEITPQSHDNRNGYQGFRVLVKTLAGKTISLPVSASTTVPDLQEMTRIKEGIPVTAQRLAFGGKQLGTLGTLADYKIEHGAIIFLLLRLPEPDVPKPGVLSFKQDGSCTMAQTLERLGTPNTEAESPYNGQRTNTYRRMSLPVLLPLAGMPPKTLTAGFRYSARR